MSIKEYFKKAKVEERDDVRELRALDAASREAFLSLVLTEPIVAGLQACPGAGKTTIALNLIERNDGLKFVLLYFNRAMAKDAKDRVNKAGLTNVDVFTIDAVARGAHKGIRGKPFDHRDDRFAEEFKDTDALQTWKRFTKVGDEIPAEDEDERGIADIAKWVRDSVANGEWWDFATCCKLMQIGNMWPSALSQYDVVMIDEAQDMKPAVVAGLAKMHGIKPVVYIGDTDQALYAYDGAVDAFETLRSSFTHSIVLPGTYRFGQDIADAVNEHGFASRPIVSLTERRSRVCQEPPRLVTSYTYLFRSNMQMFRTAAQTPNCHIPEMNKKIDELIKSKKRKLIHETHPPEFDEYNRYKDKLECLHRRIKSKMRRTKEGSVFFSTVHGFKGNEADHVRIGPDIMVDEDDKIKLVALTRARYTLIM